MDVAKHNYWPDGQMVCSREKTCMSLHKPRAVVIQQYQVTATKVDSFRQNSVMYIKRTCLNPDSSRETSFEDSGLKSHLEHGLPISYLMEESWCVRFAFVLRQLHLGHFQISGKNFKKKTVPKVKAELRHNDLGNNIYSVSLVFWKQLSTAKMFFEVAY